MSAAEARALIDSGVVPMPVTATNQGHGFAVQLDVVVAARREGGYGGRLLGFAGLERASSPMSRDPPSTTAPGTVEIEMVDSDGGSRRRKLHSLCFRGDEASVCIPDQPAGEWRGEVTVTPDVRVLRLRANGVVVLEVPRPSTQPVIEAYLIDGEEGGAVLLRAYGAPEQARALVDVRVERPAGELVDWPRSSGSYELPIARDEASACFRRLEERVPDAPGQRFRGPVEVEVRSLFAAAKLGPVEMPLPDVTPKPRTELRRLAKAQLEALLTRHEQWSRACPNEARWLDSQARMRTRRRRQPEGEGSPPCPRPVGDAGHGGLADTDLTSLFVLDRSLRHLSLRGARLTFGAFNRTDLHGADLRGADLRRLVGDGVILSQAQLDGAVAEDAVLIGRFENSSWRGASLRRATLSGAFQRANLSNADLRDASLYGSFQGASLVGADLRGARVFGDLRGADLTNARTEGSDFADATR